MTVQYVTSGAWGTGTGTPLAAATIDGNFWSLQSQISGLTLATPVGISTFTVSGSTFTVTLTDSTVQGPFTLPMLHWNARGAWAASTAYAVADTFYINGAAYEVLIAHTSALTFSAGATDGLGHNLYGEILASPSNTLPTGGAVGAVLAKNTTTDFDVVWTTPHYVIAGGTTGQVLSKSSGTDYALAWITLPNGIPTAGATGQFVGYGGTSGVGAWATVLQLPVGGTTGQVLSKNSATDGDASWVTPSSGSTLPSSANANDVLLWNGSAWVNGSPSPQPQTITGATYTLVIGDAFTLKTVPAGTTITVPLNSSVPFDIGTEIYFINPAGAPATFVDTGASPIYPQNSSQYNGATGYPGGVCYLKKTAINTWTMFGDLQKHSASLGSWSGTNSVDGGARDIWSITPAGATTINATAVYENRLTFIFTTSGVTSYAVTFGTAFKSSGVVNTGTTSGKIWTVTFQGDGTNYYEVSRAGPL